eukprot:gene34016-41951_t
MVSKKLSFLGGIMRVGSGDSPATIDVVTLLWDVVTFEHNQEYLLSPDLRLVELFVRLIRYERGYYRIKSLRSMWQLLAFNMGKRLDIVRMDSGISVIAAFHTLITLMFSGYLSV